MTIEYTVIAGDKTTVHLNNYDMYMDMREGLRVVDEVIIKKRVLTNIGGTIYQVGHDPAKDDISSMGATGNGQTPEFRCATSGVTLPLNSADDSSGVTGGKEVDDV